EAGTVYDVLARASNWVTSLELGLSGYHAATMAMEAYISKLAGGIKDIGQGIVKGDVARILRGTGSALSSPVAALTQPFKGYKMEQIYLGNTPGSPEMARIVKLLEQGGGRGSGVRHAPDYDMSKRGSSGNFVRAWRQGA